ncbi:MAG: hypothetical protein CMJ76_12375 [Planctomycetaceae bacterium]|nr:hypothetical protein [Planctomycetaceae bacterium]
MPDKEQLPLLNRKSPFLGVTNALLVLMLVCFLVPFALRGSRTAMENMQNDVKNWLPSDYPETQELNWFGSHFMGEQFIVVTWQGCNENDESYQLLIEKLRNEILLDPETLPPLDPRLEGLELAKAEYERAYAAELFRAREKADQLGLYALDDYNFDFAGMGEKWLRGKDNKSYFITEDGKLWVSKETDDVIANLKRAFRRGVLKDISVEAEVIDQFGEDFRETGESNDFFDDPRKLTSRYFTSVRSGPDAIEELAGANGVLLPRGQNMSDENRQTYAEQLAYSRLTGTLFAPVNQAGFEWTPTAFVELLNEDKIAEFPEGWETKLDEFVKKILEEQFGGDRQALKAATSSQRASLWYTFFQELGVQAPSRQTCIIVTLSDIGEANLKKVVGRGIGREPRGKLVVLAEESGVTAPPKPSMAPWARETKLEGKVIRMGGPPVDNASIDEEGQITLGRLVGLSVILGVCLSYLSFRSLNVTLMVFFVGGVGAIMSMAIVGYAGGIVDSVLLSMPSLVYVLGISGAVHIVNYYRDAVFEEGELRASESALAHGAWPCTIASFTTALGLFSLYISNLTPIKNFGLYSGLGVLATLVLLFTYLPAALKLWVPKFDKPQTKKNKSIEESLLTRFWMAVGARVMDNYKLVICLGFCVLGISIWGLTKVNMSVQLLKLFDGQAKIIRDYEWMEENFGKLTPMEMVVKVGPETALPSRQQRIDNPPTTVDQQNHQKYQLTMLERIELVESIQSAVEEVFGDQGQDVIGQGMSAVTFAPELPPASSRTTRSTTNSILEQSTQQLIDEDYLAYEALAGQDKNELWRISLRLGALNDVDYGEFVTSLKTVVEPIQMAYQFRNYLLHRFEAERGQGADLYNAENVFFDKNKVLIIGADPTRPILQGSNDSIEGSSSGNVSTSVSVDTVGLFSKTLNSLLLVKGFYNHPRHPSQLWWLDPEKEQVAEMLQGLSQEQWKSRLAAYDYVIAVSDHPRLEKKMIAENSANFIDISGFNEDGLNGLPKVLESSANTDAGFDIVYTGVVPIVYKAQNELLNSLIESIGLAFVMIAIVMMVMMRNGKLSPTNLANIRGGMVSMIPNVFPVILVFGLMGHLGAALDIGSMMTASVAMGVAVDDTIHFLTWFRKGLNKGLARRGALMLAYQRCGAAMTQTTLIGGLGLSVFALSSFTPTQRFGVLMLTLLAAALLGDLLFLPAILSSPLGKYFASKETIQKNQLELDPSFERVGDERTTIGGPHDHLANESNLERIIRHDKGHKYEQ